VRRGCGPRENTTPIGPGFGAGNIGPTLWWNGEIVGSWAIAPDGDVRTTVIADRGAEAHAASDRAASRLHTRLNAAAVTPAIRTPLEQALTRDDSESTA
jgi:hypothetical protein